MRNALILHGTDFAKDQKQRLGNWFPWLKKELEKIGYEVWLPELPEAWHPDLDRYWNFLKDFDFNDETIVIGHSSGGAAVFGLLHKLPFDKKIKLAISVAGFYKDEGWNCEGLFKENFDWNKIKNQAEKITVIYSDDDPYVKPYHAEYFRNKLNTEPILIKGKKHFNLEASEQFKQFPELLEIINQL
jgi:uncharacterized protein